MEPNYPIKLTPDKLEQALNCAAISYSPKKGQVGIVYYPEKWFCDLDLIVEIGRGRGTSKWECTIGCSIDRTVNDEKYILTVHPYDNIDEWLTDLPEQQMTDERAVEYLRVHMKNLIKTVTKKGIYWSVKDSNWKIGRHRNNIYFQPTKPRGFRGTIKPHPDDWRILHDPTNTEELK